ncbi:hypothetical protein PV331_39445 [Streptomyces sp. WI04-05B]|nr:MULTISPECIES: hypothetical protein [unclassified Streptomyces]MDX2547885.1 hypothetical protein [Streptomyces sp. WI04-05B]MDX2584426.1 hypothetical protein [Streptomyces sp. WI04-05A]MDX3753290.1 hypothetical protein [Streptomyces sp. AK08-02]
MSATENTSASMSMNAPRPKRNAVPGVSMRDLLASCAAARAVSTPPRPPEVSVRRQPEAA